MLLLSSIEVGERFESLISHLVESGRYADPSEVVREGLRLLEEAEQVREARVVELRRMVEEARAEPGLLTEDEVFSRLEARYADDEVAAQRG